MLLPPLRSVLLLASASLLLSSVAGCKGQTPDDQSPYARWAEQVSSIPLLPEADAPSLPSAPKTTKDDAPAPLKVELLTPHQLWDARNGPLNVPTIEVNDAVTTALKAAASQPPTASPAAPVTPASAPATSPSTTRLVQLGAFSSQQSAQTAWQRIANLNPSFKALQPQYEQAVVGEKNLVRLRVYTSPQQALILCEAAGLTDPWCTRPGS